MTMTMTSLSPTVPCPIRVPSGTRTAIVSTLWGDMVTIVTARYGSHLSASQNQRVCACVRVCGSIIFWSECETRLLQACSHTVVCKKNYNLFRVSTGSIGRDTSIQSSSSRWRLDPSTSETLKADGKDHRLNTCTCFYCEDIWWRVWNGQNRHFCVFDLFYCLCSLENVQAKYGSLYYVQRYLNMPIKNKAVWLWNVKQWKEISVTLIFMVKVKRVLL